MMGAKKAVSVPAMLAAARKAVKLAAADVGQPVPQFAVAVVRVQNDRGIYRDGWAVRVAYDESAPVVSVGEAGAFEVAVERHWRELGPVGAILTRTRRVYDYCCGTREPGTYTVTGPVSADVIIGSGWPTISGYERQWWKD